ncbi:MAG TPA: MASE1 domain-containing protein [Holophagaceae bacterium]|nr:MASE1 domain-containing protein [Holophagaceae bacterium]
MEVAGSHADIPMPPARPLRGGRYPLAVGILAGLYALAAGLGLRFAFAGANVSPLWPPTGMAIAALVLFGLRLWPGVLAGAFIANLLVSPLPVWVALGISAGNCAEAVVAAALLRHAVGFQPAFPRFKDTLAWISLAAGAGPLVSASVGTAVLAFAGIVPGGSLGNAWWTWFSGDALGALVVGPVLLAWAGSRPFSWTRPGVWQAAGILAVLAAVSGLVFLTPMAAREDLSPLAFATLPLLFWAGQRYGPRGATLGTFIVCAFAIWGTVGGEGAYSGFRELNEKVRLLQAFIALAAAASLGFATLSKELDLAKEKRRFSEESFRRLVQSVTDYAIFMLDPEGKVISWNEGAERIKGYGSAEILGRSVSLFYPPEEVDRGKPAADLREAALRGRFEEEGWRVRKDGSLFYANLTLTAIRDGEGAVQGFIKVTRDITERMILVSRLRAHKQELEQQVQLRTLQLAQSQQTLYLVYDGVQDPMAMVAPDPGGVFRLASCNRACAALLGSTPKELVGKPVAEAVGAGFQEEVLATLREASRNGQALSLERRLCGAEGERVFDVQITPILGESGECAHLLVAARDISERHRIEAAARKAQKLESLGMMAGGIAHDFNNLLTGIMGNVSLGLMSVEPASRANAFFERIEQAATRAADLTRQLLAYTGKGKFMLADVDLNAVVQEVTRLFPSSLPGTVSLRNELQEGLPAVKADPLQMQQAVINLLTNAAEAIGGDREAYITLRTGSRQLDAAYLKDAEPEDGLEPGLYTTLEVTDTGAGMSPEVQARIFDPFFTTKFTGRGLGLPALLGILRSHRGGIKVYSEPGVGSTFTLFLPAVRTPQPLPAPAPDAQWRWEGTVLVVDDDDMIRSLAARIAEHLGLSVLEARDGQEAVELFQERHRDLSLVVMDLTMPRMGGGEAFARMREIDPAVPIVLSSGYDEEDVTRPFVEKGLAGFLQKPYRREAFVLALQQGLSKRPRAQQGSGPIKAV